MSAPQPRVKPKTSYEITKGGPKPASTQPQPQKPRAPREETQEKDKSKSSTLPFAPGPNTKIICGNTIDFDRVAAIDKVENEFNGRQTYGIKFTFRGQKGAYRIAWYNCQRKERDRVFEEETAYWLGLQQAKR